MGDEMGYSGNLASEFKDTQKMDALHDYHHSTEHLLENDGIFTVKEMILGGAVLSLGCSWCGACLFAGWQFGRLVYYAVRSMITLII